MHALKLLAGSALTYALVAACGGSGGVSSSAAGSAGGPAENAAGGPTEAAGTGPGLAGSFGAGEGGQAGSGEEPDSGGRAGELADAGLVDALIDPVPDAAAQEAGAAGGAGEAPDGGSGAPACNVVCECECPELEPYEPPEPTMVVADCDIEVQNPLVQTVYAYYATAEFPGRSVVELASVRVVLPQLAAFTDQRPPAITHVADLPMIADGRVWAYCGARNGTSDIDKVESVTFVLP